MFARTERLLLRPGWIEDAAELQAGIGDEAVVRNLATAPWPYRLDDAQSFLSMPRDSAEPNFLISLRTGGAARIIGGVGLVRHDDATYELGYWIARPYWGLGFATEAARAVVGIARAMQLPRLISSHMVDNPASGKVLRKLGFAPTGRIVPRYSAARGTEVATVEYAESEDGVCAMQDPCCPTYFPTDPRREFRQMAA